MASQFEITERDAKPSAISHSKNSSTNSHSSAQGQARNSPLFGAGENRSPLISSKKITAQARDWRGRNPHFLRFYDGPSGENGATSIRPSFQNRREQSQEGLSGEVRFLPAKGDSRIYSYALTFPSSAINRKQQTLRTSLDGTPPAPSTGFTEFDSTEMRLPSVVPLQRRRPSPLRLLPFLQLIQESNHV